MNLKKLFLGIFLIVMAMCQVNAQSYNNFSQNWVYSVFTQNSVSGGGSVTVSISNNILSVNFSAGFSSTPLKTGDIVYLNTTPALPNANITLGSILNNSANPTGYAASINNGWLRITSQSTPPAITGFTCILTANLSDVGVVYDPSIKNTTLYGYNHVLPIAEIENAGLNQVAYTSFESITTQETNTWAYSNNHGSTLKARTGSKYYTHTSSTTIERTNLPKGKYTLSYWSTSAITSAITAQFISNSTLIPDKNDTNPEGFIDGWKYYEKTFEITATTDGIRLNIGSNVGLDEVRLHPVNASMMTSTYNPLVGVTSKTDTNNMTVYYEYDHFGRLEFVRDHEGNIIKQTMYYTKGQN